jgi:predicted dehydrogenase
MLNKTTRREMLRNTTLASLSMWAAGQTRSAIARSTNEKLNVACIGVGGRGAANLNAVAREGENIVALCDVDEERAGSAFDRFPKARKYYDFRKMLDEMEKQIDAVVVSTPDHTHAGPSVMALRMGKHVYCEKPLAHNVYEARLMAQVAAESKVATQLGTQHHARSTHRRVVELIQSGAIGRVREAHATIGGNRGGGERPTDTPPVPSRLNWDLWLGPRPWRPYHPDYVPYRWRFWWDFGTGETGNNGVHILDLPFWALKLRHPETIEASGPPVHPETSPKSMTVRFRFPARDEMPPVALHFYHSKTTPAAMAENKLPEWRPDILGDWTPRVSFVGEEGMLVADLSHWKLLPESKFADFGMPEPTIPESIGHHKEWITACKAGSPTTCNFDYGGALTEMVLLGNVAYRAGRKLEWDPMNLKATNCPDADPYVQETYREGWTL